MVMKQESPPSTTPSAAMYWPILFGLVVWCFNTEVSSRILERLAPEMAPAKIIKCQTYVTEIVVTTAAALLAGISGLWSHFFSTAYSTDQNTLNETSCVAFTLVSVLYLTELCVDPAMRSSLKLHHIAFILLIMLATINAHYVSGIAFTRLEGAVLLLPNTEQVIGAGRTGH